MPVNHQIQPGDSISSLADQYGLFVDTIWNHPQNEPLKDKRKDMDILMPGDVVFIPDKRVDTIDKPTDQKHKFKRKGVPALFKLQLFDVEQPRANQDYVLIVDGKVFQGTTDGDGVLQEHVSPQAKQGELTIGPDQFELTIQFGQLDPIDEVSGIQKRLNNLGFDCGEADGTLNDQTRNALRQFQARFKLTETGEADQATKDKLRDVNDQVNHFPQDPPEGN